ncbi:4Fe-4S binding protein [Candidatus Omnitrophota bacterium]
MIEKTKSKITYLLSAASVFLLVYVIYAIKGHMWPVYYIPYERFYLFNLSPGFLYAILYTTLLVIFGIPAYRRWSKDPYQRWRYRSFFFFQLVFFFIIPEIIFQFVLKDPDFRRTYQWVYAWPLSWNAFFDNPPKLYAIWGIILSFFVIPVFVRFHGVRYCSWICGCGALAETLGDRWRHLAPKGKRAQRLEWMGTPILVVAIIIAIGVLFRGPLFGVARRWYSWIVDIWLVGIIPMALYPFMGGKIWCRYWCPLSRAMHLLSKWYGKLKIAANNDCIQCGACNKNCQVGVDVMGFAKEGKSFSNKETACIGCGICITVCPKDVLKFSR